MTPKQKAFILLEKVNNAKITEIEWAKCSNYAKKSLKSKAIIIINEIIDALNITTSHLSLRKLDLQEVEKDFEFWHNVKKEVESF